MPEIHRNPTRRDRVFQEVQFGLVRPVPGYCTLVLGIFAKEKHESLTLLYPSNHAPVDRAKARPWPLRLRGAAVKPRAANRCRASLMPATASSHASKRLY